MACGSVVVKRDAGLHSLTAFCCPSEANRAQFLIGFTFHKTFVSIKAHPTVVQSSSAPRLSIPSVTFPPPRPQAYQRLDPIFELISTSRIARSRALCRSKRRAIRGRRLLFRLPRMHAARACVSTEIYQSSWWCWR